MVLLKCHIENHRNLHVMRILTYLLALLSASFLFSCDSITEEIHLSEKGNGKYEMYLQMSPSMLGLLGGLAGEDGGGAMDSLMSQIPEDWDTLIPMNEQFADKLKEKPQYKNLAAKSQFFGKVNKDEDQLRMGFRTTFNNMDELNTFQEMLKFVGKEEEEGGESNSMSGLLTGAGIQSHFKGQKKRFSRKAELNPSDKLDMEGMDEGERSMMESMMPKFRTVVHLPRRVKSVKKGDSYTLQDSDKTVVFEYDFMEVMKGEKSMDFDIIMGR